LPFVAIDEIAGWGPEVQFDQVEESYVDLSLGHRLWRLVEATLRINIVMLLAL
jgi:hypothetical protein